MSSVRLHQDKCLLGRNSFQSKQYTLGVFGDLSKAFHTANHKILLSKLENYGIRGKSLLWFISYLTNRIQFIKYNNLNTSLQKIICGVLQGSVSELYYFLFMQMTLHTHQKVKLHYVR